MSLFDSSAYEPDEMLAHPRHREAQTALATLIEQLRACRTVDDGMALQNELRAQLLAVQRDRHEYRRVVDRIHKHKSPHPQAPEPQSGRDTSQIETWMFERDVCARLDRQLRSVGDALAWRVFGFHRPFILALCRNDPPGPMYGKAGMQTELDQIDEAWREHGVFAIQHDLTNCLRIGDITFFEDTESPRTIEVKTNPNKARGKQLRRINQARAAVLDGALLPGGGTSEILYDLDLPLRTHLDQLRAGIEVAATDGVYASDIPGHRALCIIDQSALAHAGVTPDEFSLKSASEFTRALERAGIDSRRDLNVHAGSLDATARDPLRVPWANYPMHPVACARVIGDYTVIVVETCGPELAALLQLAGLDARWVRPPGNEDLMVGEVLMEIHHEDALRSIMLPGGLTAVPGTVLQMKRSELDRYLIELLQPGTWAAGIKYMIGRSEAGQPWPHYRDEHDVWV